MNLTDSQKKDLCHPFRGRGAAGNRPPGGSLWPSAMPKRQSSVFLLQQRLAESELPLELRRLENSWQLCTIAGYDAVIRTALELRSNTPFPTRLWRYWQWWPITSR